MKVQSLIAFCLLIVSSTQVWSGPPLNKGVNHKLNILIDALVVCPPAGPKRFVDNGDGTICDQQTGLMWEKKNAADGIPDLTNPHDTDNTYTWTSDADGDNTNPDGTVFTDFLAQLNGELAATGDTEQLGGYNNWRLPTYGEWKTILDCDAHSNCLDPIFGPSESDYYWSSTTGSLPPRNDVWVANFIDGRDGTLGKRVDSYVRAVRDGR